MLRHFLFQPGEWIGNGHISFTISPDVLHFRVKWSVTSTKENFFRCIQLVEIVDGDQIINSFDVEPKSAEDFAITIENELLGTFTGRGLIEDQLISWEFRNKGVFEGYEVYEKSDHGYDFHAEYLSSDQARTSIHGKIWKKDSSHNEAK